MKKLNKLTENCITTPSSCVQWTGGDIEYLGLCDGEYINKVILEIVEKLEDITGDDLSSFDIDGLLSICNEKAPLEVNLISILALLRDNQICLKDYIDTLNDKITELAQEGDIDVNLKCFSEFDNLGNSLQITRAELDQLVIDELCNQKERITTLEGKYTSLKNQVDNINTEATVVEPKFTTCIDAASKSTSEHVKSVATDLCSLKTSNGNSVQIAQALAKTPADWNQKYNSVQGWNVSPSNWAQAYGNALLVIANLEARLTQIETTCCAIDCDDIKLGFFTTLNTDGDALLLTFSYNSGTKIPVGFIDKGSTGSIKDKNGLEITFNLAITNNTEIEIPLSGLDLSDEVEININSKIGNGALVCDKCLFRRVQVQGTKCCSYTNDSSTDITILYEIPVSSL